VVQSADIGKNAGGKRENGLSAQEEEERAERIARRKGREI